jgi:cyclase
VRRLGVIVARIKPGMKDKVAAVFARSDAGPLPHMAGVQRRSLFVLGDLYVHVLETEEDVEESVERVRDDPLFREVSESLEPYIEPYDPATWRSPKDAMAVEFYRWEA